MREVMVRDQRLLSIVETHATKDLTRNLPAADALSMIGDLIGASFLRAHLIASTGNVDLSISKKGKGVLHRSKAGTEADVSEKEQTPDTEVRDAAPSHDRVKHRFVQQDRAYLQELGVTDRSGRVVPSMAKKWKQINKFVEILDGAIVESGLSSAERVRVLDFGSGKGYLTFALHDYLRSTLEKPARVTGVELRDELVGAANLAARRVDAEGLDFVCGDIADTSALPDADHLDIMVALHACDIATDIAMYEGVRRGAQIVVCSPCCHKELRPHMKAPGPLLPMLRYGVQLGQEAEMVTDTIRALLLEANGYDTKIFEFVGLEHSSKNKMILAVRRPRENREKQDRASSELASLMDFYGLATQHLKTLLAVPIP